MFPQVIDLLGRESEPGEAREVLVEQLDTFNHVLDHMLDGVIPSISKRHAEDAK